MINPSQLAMDTVRGRYPEIVEEESIRSLAFILDDKWVEDRLREEDVLDRFAMAALTGILADQSSNYQTYSSLANRCYEIASKMAEAKAAARG